VNPRRALALAVVCCCALAAAACGSSGNAAAPHKAADAHLSPAERSELASLDQARSRQDAAQAKRLADRIKPHPHVRTSPVTAQAPAPEAENVAATSAVATSVPRPRIVQMRIPFPARRRHEMAAYSRRHYGIDSSVLKDPKVIVEHYSVASNARAVYNTFATDRPDVELHELPQVCSHFVVDSDGTIYQLAALNIMCRHTVGLNYTSIGIEHAGFSDQDVLGNRRELKASLALTNWLRCRYGIKLKNVIGHNESLSSPYHHELIARLRTQTHGDWVHKDMVTYRSKLRKTC
jgi:N-acetylmuramoyl-L-alanine amidase